MIFPFYPAFSPAFRRGFLVLRRRRMVAEALLGYFVSNDRYHFDKAQCAPRMLFFLQMDFEELVQTLAADNLRIPVIISYRLIELVCVYRGISGLSVRYIT